MSEDERPGTVFTAFIAGIGMFLSTLDSGIINVAIPSLMKIFHSNLDVVIWTVTLYTLLLSSTIMLFGKLADRYGRIKIYRMGLLLFAVSSLLCGLSSSMIHLVGFRGLQGLAAAMMQATAIAVVTTVLDKKEIPKAIAVLGLLMGLGPTLGPVLGGAILSTIGWEWIFWINIPVCLLAFLGSQKLRTKSEKLQNQPLNYVNLLLFGFSMMFLLLSMNYLVDDKRMALFFLAATVLTFTTHLYLELHSGHPVIRYDLFKKIKFSAPMLGIFAMGGSIATSFILTPLFFEKLRQFDAWHVGLVSLSAPFGFVMASQFFSRIILLFGNITCMIVGFVLMTFALVILSMIGVEWKTSIIFGILFIQGFGGGIFVPSSMIYLTGQFPLHEQAFVTSLIRMVQNMAIAISAATTVLLINLNSLAKIHLLPGLKDAWLFASLVSFSSLIFLLCLNFYEKKLD